MKKLVENLQSSPFLPHGIWLVVISIVVIGMYKMHGFLKENHLINLKNEAENCQFKADHFAYLCINAKERDFDKSWIDSAKYYQVVANKLNDSLRKMKIELR